MSIQIRDLIEQLQRFDPTAKVTLSADAVQSDDMEKAEEAVNYISVLVGKVDNIDTEESEVKQAEDLLEIITQIKEQLDIFNPIWDDVLNSKSDGLDVRGVENRKGECGNHAVIICEK